MVSPAAKQPPPPPPSSDDDASPTKNKHHPIGTKFLKKFNGYGVWEGHITSFDVDSNSYEVLYPDDGHIERNAPSSMDKIMIRSEKLTRRKVRVAKRETDMKVEQIHTAAKGEFANDEEESGGNNNSNSSLLGPFRKGQHVWVTTTATGKEKQPAVIHSVGKIGSENNFTPMVRIEWSMTNLFQDVAVSMVVPMFEERGGNGGGGGGDGKERMITSAHSRRARKQTESYAPPSKKRKKESGGKGSYSIKHKREAKEEEPLRGVVAPTAKNKVSPKAKSVHSKGSYHHEDFRYFFARSLSSKPEDIYRCSSRQTHSCPMNLRVNRETGVATTYTANDEPVEHSDSCKCKHDTMKASSEEEQSLRRITTASKKAPSKESIRGYRHGGFNFNLGSSPSSKPEDIYYCRSRQTYNCPVGLRVNRETGVATPYTSNDELVEHSDSCKCKHDKIKASSEEQSSRGVATTKKDASSKKKLSSQTKSVPNPSKKSKGAYHHEGFKYLLHASSASKDTYCCGSIQSHNCPMKLRVNRQTGAATTYTTHDEPVEHSDSCKCKHERIKAASQEKEPPRGVATTKKDASSKKNVSSNTKSVPDPSRKSKLSYHHEGFRYFLHSSLASKPEDVYYCCSRKNHNCPMKLRVNRETGVVTPCTTAEQAVEHSNPCKCNHGKNKATAEIESSRGVATVRKRVSSKESSRIYHHEGFKFYLNSSPSSKPEDVYYCSSCKSHHCPMKLRVNRETGVATPYTINSEPVEHADSCKCKHGKNTIASEEEESLRGVTTSKKKESSTESRGIHNHEGFKFTFHRPHARNTSIDVYRCSRFSSANCPVKLRLNRESGVAAAYTRNNDPVEHTDECKCKNGVTEALRCVIEGGQTVSTLSGDSAASKARPPSRSNHVYHHEGFKFTLHGTRVRTPEFVYRCCHFSSANCPVKLKLNHETGVATLYTSNNEPVEHTDECKCKNGMAKETPSIISQPPTYYNHEGSQFRRVYEGVFEPEDTLYCCSWSRSTNCPMKLKVNQETGIATPYTSNGEPLEHTEECQVNNHRLGISTVTADEVAEASTDQCFAAKSDAAMQGVETRRDSAAGSGLLNDDCGTLNEEQDKADSCSNDCKHHLFEKGQHVWVCSRKAQHPAVIVSVQHDIASVRWATMNTIDDVKVDKLIPMFEEEDGMFIISSSSKRKRRETSRFTHSLLSVKKVKVQKDLPKHEKCAKTKAKKCKTPAVPRNVKASEEDADFIRKHLDSYAQVPSGVAPGPDWKKCQSRGRNGKPCTQWVSPGGGLVFGFPRVAFEFEQIRQQCDGDEVQALELYKKQRKAAGKSMYVRNVKADGEDADFIRENLDCCGQIPSGVAPGPGWKSRQERTQNGQCSIRWISPTGENVFAYRRVAFEFEQIRQQCDGDEVQALELYKKQRKAAGKQSQVTSAKTDGESSDFIRKDPVCDAQFQPGVAPGPDWKSRSDVVWCQKRPFARNIKRWISPSEGFIFRNARAAFEFEQFRQQCDDNEEQALELYKNQRKIAGKKSEVMKERHRQTTAGGKTMEVESDAEMDEDIESVNSNENMSSSEMEARSIGPKSDVEVEEDAVPLDSYENMTIAEIECTAEMEVRSIGSESDAEEEEDAESLDSHENVTIAEIEYRTLWDYYLKPTTRDKEEIPSGMILRRRTASCNLLRYRNSVFRQLVHRKILRLERSGKKNEIYRILKDMYNHDKSMQSGDGPRQLLDEILGQQKVDDEIEVLDASAIAALQDCYSKTDSKFENVLKSNASPGIAERIDLGDIEDRASKSPDIHVSTDLHGPSMLARNAAGFDESNDAQGVEPDEIDSVSVMVNAFVDNEFNDLCEGGDLDQSSLLSSSPLTMGRKESCDIEGVETDDLGRDDVSVLVKDFIDKEFSHQCEDDDLDEVSLLSDLGQQQICQQQAVRSTLKEWEGEEVEVDCATSTSEMYRDPADPFEDDEHELPISFQLAGKPIHQKQASQGVLQELSCEDTTTESSVTSSTSNNTVHKSLDDDEHMSNNDILNSVSPVCVMGVAVALNKSANHQVAAKGNGPHEAEVGGTESSPNRCNKVINLCEDDDFDQRMPTISELAQKSKSQQLGAYGVSQEWTGDETTVDSTVDSSVNDESNSIAKHEHQQKIPNNVSSGTTAVHPSQKSRRSNKQQKEVIDLSREDDLQTTSSDEDMILV